MKILFGVTLLGLGLVVSGLVNNPGNLRLQQIKVMAHLCHIQRRDTIYVALNVQCPILVPRPPSQCTHRCTTCCGQIYMKLLPS